MSKYIFHSKLYNNINVCVVKISNTIQWTYYNINESMNVYPYSERTGRRYLEA